MGESISEWGDRMQAVWAGLPGFERRAILFRAAVRNHHWLPEEISEMAMPWSLVDLTVKLGERFSGVVYEALAGK